MPTFNESHKTTEKHVLRQDVFFEKINDGYLLLHPTKATWLELNRSGKYFYELADGSRSVDEMVATITDSYQISSIQARRDLEQFLAAMEKAGFSETTESVFPDEKVSPPSYSLFFHLNKTCNLSCPHCYTQSAPQKYALPEIEDVKKLLKDCQKNGVTSMTLSGGEPLLYPRIEDVLRYASSLMPVQLLTNGTLLTEKTVNFIVETCSTVQISLDGPSSDIHDRIRGHGAFQKSIDGIKRLQDKGYNSNLVICTTVTNNNINDIPELFELTKSLKIPVLRFLPLMIQGRAEITKQEICPTDEAMVSLYERMLPNLLNNTSTTIVSGYISGLLMTPLAGVGKEQWCPVGRNIVVDFDGTISPCILMCEQHWNIGNLYKESLSEILKRGQLQRMGLMVRKRRHKIDRCRECSWKNLCQSGCPGIALQQKGTFLDVDRFCQYRQELYPRIFSFMLAYKKQLLRTRQVVREKATLHE